MTYSAEPSRYSRTAVRRSGRSGLRLPLISLGMWQNFGNDRTRDSQRDVILGAFDRGIYHFDLANNYGPPYGASEENFGRVLATDLAAHRDEVIISTKAGWDMWSGPHGAGASRKHLVTSLDRSLERMGVDSVDIFYSHRPDPGTPLEETAAALDYIVRSGRAHYVGLSSYSTEAASQMSGLLRALGTPLTIHQPSYNMLNRWVESEGLLDVAEREGFGVIGFTALAQGLLTNKYLSEVPNESRAASPGSFTSEVLTDELRRHLRALSDIAEARGQNLAQLAISWALRDERMTSLVVGARTVDQLDENWRALQSLELSSDELAAIDVILDDSVVARTDVDLWADARLGGEVPFIA